MKILAIETSCDETACAIVEYGLNIISSSVSSSKDLHMITGGVVPEVAARKQVDYIIPVLNDCLTKAKLDIEDIDAIAVTIGPGLIGSLLIGIEFSKALSFAYNKPLIPVNHLIGHVYSGLLNKNINEFVLQGSVGDKDITYGIDTKDTKDIKEGFHSDILNVNNNTKSISDDEGVNNYTSYAIDNVNKNDLRDINYDTDNVTGDAIKNVSNLLPAIGFVVSGGHTDLILVKGINEFEFLGGTLDDAAGEAFDKNARLLGLSSYLGAAELSQLASTCKKNTLSGFLPRPMINSKNYDFSFSGLKTAAKNLINKNEYEKNVIACEFENAVCDVLVKKCIDASIEHNVKSIFLGGGVSANKQLRTRLSLESKINSFNLFIPSLDLTGDNAVYIATAAYFSINGTLDNFTNKRYDQINAIPNLEITGLV